MCFGVVGHRWLWIVIKNKYTSHVCVGGTKADSDNVSLKNIVGVAKQELSNHYKCKI